MQRQPAAAVPEELQTGHARVRLVGRGHPRLRWHLQAGGRRRGRRHHRRRDGDRLVLRFLVSRRRRRSTASSAAAIAAGTPKTSAVPQCWREVRARIDSRPVPRIRIIKRCRDDGYGAAPGAPSSASCRTSRDRRRAPPRYDSRGTSTSPWRHERLGHGLPLCKKFELHLSP